jgi:(S)-3,5-dihydroxyphenylglycine transaminase
MRNGSPDHELSLDTLHHSLTDPALESMNFLNKVASRYPEAVSFASGRPAEEFSDVKLIHDYIDTYCRYLKSDRGFSDGEVNQILFQWNLRRVIETGLDRVAAFVAGALPVHDERHSTGQYTGSA